MKFTVFITTFFLALPYVSASNPDENPAPVWPQMIVTTYASSLDTLLRETEQERLHVFETELIDIFQNSSKLVDGREKLETRFYTLFLPYYYEFIKSPHPDFSADYFYDKSCIHLFEGHLDLNLRRQSYLMLRFLSENTNTLTYNPSGQIFKLRHH